MAVRVDSKKWILYRHINDFNLLCSVAEYLKSFSGTAISKDEKIKLNLKLREVGLYSERNPEMPLDAISHKINQLSYYMFGYKAKIAGRKRFLFSPLGNLLLKNTDNKEKTSKIFLTMLWAFQYPHPQSGTASEFQLYPFRLIFKLLSDYRLGYKLFAFEVSTLIVFTKTITIEFYEVIVDELLKLRQLTDKELSEKFETDPHAFVNSAYEWDYYVTNLFVGAGLIEKNEGKVITKLKHGKTATYRKITRNEISIAPSLLDLVANLEKEYSYIQTPLLLNDPERLTIDVIKEIFNFFPKSLLRAIGEDVDDLKLELLNLPKLIDQYSNNNDGLEAYLFEDILVEGFNLFYNLEAEKVGGAGKTDIECLYITRNKKIAVDAKSTKNKLTIVNSGRLEGHRESIGGVYTIVVTPRYVPAVLQDIKSSPIVIIRASTFSEYLYNCINSDIRQIDYEDFDNIIMHNLGKDISKVISNLTISRFATSN